MVGNLAHFLLSWPGSINLSKLTIHTKACPCLANPNQTGGGDEGGGWNPAIRFCCTLTLSIRTRSKYKFTCTSNTKSIAIHCDQKNNQDYGG